MFMTHEQRLRYWRVKQDAADKKKNLHEKENTKKPDTSGRI